MTIVASIGYAMLFGAFLCDHVWPKVVNRLHLLRSTRRVSNDEQQDRHDSGANR